MDRGIRKAVILIALLTGLAHQMTAQVFQALKNAEDSLSLYLFTDTVESDLERNQRQLRIQSLLAKALELPGSISYPFSALKGIGQIYSPDKTFRIFNWNVCFQDGRHKYYGILQFAKGGRNSVQLLNDHSDRIENPEQKILVPEQWYGALYYIIIPFKLENREDAYILLGWHGKDAQITEKVIEVMHIDNQKNVVFGGKVFKQYEEELNTRVIFRFSSSASMVLRYEAQRVTSKPKWNAKTREFIRESKKMNMIVCDHLVSLDPSLQGQFQSYVPASDQVDGFMFENGYWVFMADIDARNRAE